jgi:uncharacterized protein
MSRILVAVGDPEYFSHESVPALAEEWRVGGHDVTVARSSVVEDEPDFPISEFVGLDALAEADLLVIFTRFRVLPDAQMAMFSNYLDSGRPVLGLRTSSHAFRFPADSAWHGWNDGFGRDVLGTPWISHHGHASRTRVTILPEAKEHPILAGVAADFEVRSWLYHVRIPPGKQVEPLLHGAPVDTAIEPEPGPVAWTTSNNGGRVFFTTLGHRDDFAVPAARTLINNAVDWCLDSSSTRGEGST